MARFSLFKNRNADHGDASAAVGSTNNTHSDVGPNVEPVAGSAKGRKALTGKIPDITFRTVIMAVLVAMGGFIFGYDTGQISGFLEMQVFLERFGERTTVNDDHPFGFYFSNVRSGLIVGLVCSCWFPTIPSSNMLIFGSCPLAH